MARSDHPAGTEHLYGRQYLLLSSSLCLGKVERSDQGFHGCLRLKLRVLLLHPQNAAQILIDSPRSMALTTAGKEFSCLRQFVGSEHQLVGSASAAGAGLAAHISANSPDFPFLFLHGCPPEGWRPPKVNRLGTSWRMRRKIENTEEVGQSSPKEGGS